MVDFAKYLKAPLPALQPGPLLPSFISLDNVFGVTGTLTFKKPGLWFVTGRIDGTDKSNGGGKTSCLNAIWWAITGLLLKSAEVDDVVGKPASEASSAVGLSGSGKIIISRSRGRGRPVSLTFMLDGEDLTARNPTMTQELIGEKLGLDWKVLPYTNYLPQLDTESSFLFASPPKRRQIITAVYQKTDIDRIEKEVEREASKARKAHTQAEKDLAVAKARVDEAQRSIVDLEAKLKAARAVTAVPPEKLAEAAAAVKAAEADERACIAQHEAATAKADAAKEASREADKKHDACQREIGQIERGMADNVRQNKELRASVEDGGKCPTCGQAIKGNADVHIVEKVNALIDAYQAMKSQRDALKKQDSGLAKTAASAATASVEATRAVEACREKGKGIARRLGDARRALEALRSVVVPDIAGLEAMLAEATDRLQEVLAGEIEADATFEDATSTLAKMEVCLNAYRHELRIRAFGSVVERFSEEVNVSMRLICDDEFRIRVDSRNEDDQEGLAILVAEAEAPEEWRNAKSTSGGELDVINLSTNGAVRRVAAPRLGLLLFDESLKHIDGPTSLRAMALLEEEAKRNVVLYVTHSTETVPRGANVIEVVRYPGKRIEIHQGAA